MKTLIVSGGWLRPAFLREKWEELCPDLLIAADRGMDYALDAGLQAENALFKESEYADNSYYCLIAVRSEDAENPVYQRIVEAYQCDEVIDVYNSQFAGFFTPTWKLEG